jgi:hypothetical protein
MRCVGWLSVATCILVAGLSGGCVNHPSSKAVGDPCRPQQLRAEVSGPQGTGGPAEYRITIRDQGAACSLRGAPTALEGIDLTGRTVHLTTTPFAQDWIAATTTGKVANLTSGSSADVVLLTGIGCPAAEHPTPTETYRSLRLGIETGIIDVPFGQGPDPSNPTVSLPCFVEMSNFYSSFPTN